VRNFCGKEPTEPLQVGGAEENLVVKLTAFGVARGRIAGGADYDAALSIAIQLRFDIGYHEHRLNTDPSGSTAPEVHVGPLHILRSREWYSG
jgi:hypothetical protein